MACQRYYELISQRLDGELTEDEQQELESHLAVCPSCRALDQQLSGLHEDFFDLEEVPAPEGFAQGVMDRIRTEESKKVIPLFRRPQFKAAAGLAACLVLCAGLYGAGQLDLPGQDVTAQSAGTTAQQQTQDVQPQNKVSQEDLPSSSETNEDVPDVASYSFADGEVTDGDPAQAEIPVPRVYGSDSLSLGNAKEQNSVTQQPKAEENAERAQLPEDVLDSQPPQDSQSNELPQAEPNDPGAAPEVTGTNVDQEDETRSFQNEQYLSVTYGATPQAPSAVILGSVQSLTDYLAAFSEDDLSAVSQAYDETYFASGRLLAVLVETGSGSNSFTLPEDGLSDEQVVLEENRPQEGTCDMAAWLIVAEVGTEFSDGQELEVSVVTP